MAMTDRATADKAMTADELRESIEGGWTLPASWYHDPEILALEKQRIFERSWQYVGRADTLAKPGDYVTARLGEVPVVVVRNDRDELAGFVNVCRHRCAEVVLEAGSRKTLQCHYHAWTYNLDGELVSAPRSDREPCFDAADFSLHRVLVERWGPFVFANADLDASSLEDQLGELPAKMAADGLDFEAVSYAERSEWIVEANWKVVVENYDECYHCPVAHPSFSRLLEVDPVSYELEQGARWSRASTPLRTWKAGLTPKLPYQADGPIRRGQFGFLWPNFTIVQNPGANNVMAFFFVPVAPERTLVISEYFFGADIGPEVVKEMVDFNLLVGAEDQRLVESVQRGLRSGRVTQGRLLLDSERLLQHFHRLVSTALSN